MNVTLVCVGKLKERWCTDAAGEYIKRLSAYCRIDVRELPEEKLSAAPSQAENEAALKKEGKRVLAAVPSGAYVAAMCIEGGMMTSEKLASHISQLAGSGKSRICFIIGGSLGLSDEVKQAADLRLSMSPMTFPHHFARVMLLEQLYRSFSIISGGKYHK